MKQSQNKLHVNKERMNESCLVVKSTISSLMYCTQITKCFGVESKKNVLLSSDWLIIMLCVLIGQQAVNVSLGKAR